jgi:Ser/Thr protein kinase RdoA (MazF antagonist)
MGKFKDLSWTEQAHRLTALAREALPRFGISRDASLTLINHRENAVFRLDDPASGQRFAMRVHREHYQSEQSIRSEVSWMEALGQAGVRTPEVCRGTDGEPVQTVSVPEVPEPRHCDLFRWIEGTPPDPEDMGTYRLLGEINARLHKHAKSWQRPPGFHRHFWDDEGLLGELPIWGRFQDLKVLSGEQRDLLFRARDVAREKLDRFGKDPDRFGLVHADFMPENILVGDGVPRVIDFDDSGFGWFMYDLATLLAFLFTDPDRYQRTLQAWVEGYRSVSRLPDDHLEVLPPLIMARFLISLGWLHTRSETPMAVEMTEIGVLLACQYAQSFR